MIFKSVKLIYEPRKITHYMQFYMIFSEETFKSLYLLTILNLTNNILHNFISITVYF